MFQLHIDLDTPNTLNRFYNGPQTDNKADDDYCATLLKRVADCFAECGVKATFFIITEDLELPGYGRLLKELSSQGHEMASHTHTHPYFHKKFSLKEIDEEISVSYDAIHSHFGEPPAGFRGPGFFIIDDMIPMLAEKGYRYDSSSFQAPFMRVLDFAAKLLGAPAQMGRIPPLKNVPRDRLTEFPLPSLLGLPFYHNLNLYYPGPAQKWIANLGARKKCSPYLFHLIEFADFDKDRDRLPKAIWKHPNLKQPLDRKLGFTRSLIESFKRQGEIVLARDCI